MDLESFHVRFIGMADEDINACFALRHDYFVQQKKWVNADVNGSGLETDSYDQSAWHFA